ncbi:MAG: spermidine synthase [Phycisphaeraceae bacterium]|nr:spermidine synthase [Phycisphaeraceae bacterium]
MTLGVHALDGKTPQAEFWIDDVLTPFDVYRHGVEQVIAQRRTAFQEMQVVRVGPYGKALVLDGKWQSCTGDEFLYHEPLVHVACVHHGAPETVLILGGGEGATAREALRWKSVQRVVMVDIDVEVIEACRAHLPEMHRGAFDDPRTDLVIGDAMQYLEDAASSGKRFDVIVSDLSDPIEHGPSVKLFTREAFASCHRVLAPGGSFVVQAGPISPAEMALHVRLVNTLGVEFEHVLSFGSHPPTFATPWGFALGSDKRIDRRPDPAVIDDLLTEQTSGGFRMFDGQALLGLLNGPRHIREAIDAERAGGLGSGV